MPFFDVPSDEEIPPESAKCFEEYRKAVGHDKVPDSHLTYARVPAIPAVRVHASELYTKCSFPYEVRMIAAMLIAHARRCSACFAGARQRLDGLGFDETTLDGFCAHPDLLPLTEKNRAFVHFAIKVATAPAADLTSKDFAELAAAGFSRGEMQETIGFAAYWVMNTIFNSAAVVALSED